MEQLYTNPERVDMKRSVLLALIILALIIGLGFSLYFCFTRSIPEEQIIQIDYLTHEDPARNILEEKLIAEFESLHPNIRINRQVMSSSDVLNIVPVSFEAGKSPDIFTLQQDYLSTILQNGYLAPVDLDALGYSSYAELEDDYIPGSLDGVRIGMDIYGLPMELTNWCLYINKRLFREAGLDPDKDYPRTWEEMVEICTRLVEREDGIITKRGFDFRYPYYLTFFIPMVEQLGGTIATNRNGIEIINEEAWVKAFSFMQQWGPQGLNLGSPTYINARSIFNRGDIPMMLSGLYQEARLKVENPEFYESDDWAVVPFPRFEGGQNISSSKYCIYWCVSDALGEDEKKAAWSFIGFLSSHELEYLSNVRLILPKKSVINELGKNNDIPYLDVFISGLYNSSYVYSEKESIAIGEIIEKLMKEVMLSGLDPQKAVIRLRISLDELRP